MKKSFLLLAVTVGAALLSMAAAPAAAHGPRVVVVGRPVVRPVVAPLWVVNRPLIAPRTYVAVGGPVFTNYSAGVVVPHRLHWDYIPTGVGTWTYVGR